MLLADKKQGIAIPPKNMFTSFFTKIFGGKVADAGNDADESEET